MAFCDRLRLLRQSKLPPLTQTDLANAIGVSQRKISFMETRRYRAFAEGSFGDMPLFQCFRRLFARLAR